eukprot:scaffold89644_cov45-Phaeocystis_antarctica.AAC.1
MKRDADQEDAVGPGGAGAGASLHPRGRPSPKPARCACAGDLPRRAGPPTFRSDRPDRSEPSQHAPLLPAVPTARLGPSARRRAEAPGELPASVGRPSELKVRPACGARAGRRRLEAVHGS